MGNIFNEDFVDFLTALNNNKVDYVLVGGYSVIIHGYNRTTGDLDIWVRKTEDNYLKIKHAFLQFGMPLFDMTLNNFIHNNDFDVFSFGNSPVSIDIMTSVKGLDFEKTYNNSFLFEYENIFIKVIHLNELKIAKKAANRFKDLDDLENL